MGERLDVKLRSKFTMIKLRWYGGHYLFDEFLQRQRAIRRSGSSPPSQGKPVDHRLGLPALLLEPRVNDICSLLFTLAYHVVRDLDIALPF